MEEYNLELLKQLYWIHSPSGYEEGIQGFIRHYLYTKGIPFKTDKLNQIYRLDSIGYPLVSAHSDQVKHKPISKIKETNNIIKGNSNLGADDKNGIWIILQLLIEYPELNFIISTEEEIGGNIQSLLKEKKELLSDIPYALVFDRKGKGDIVGTRNNYCSYEFDFDLSEIGKEYGFKSCLGGWSDADEISRYLNCVNLSCGYYKAHTKKEYTVKNDLINTLEFGKAIIDNITDYYELDLTNYGKTYYSGYADNYDEFGNYDGFGNKYSIASEKYSENEPCPYCMGYLIKQDLADGFCGICGFDLLEEWEDITAGKVNDQNYDIIDNDVIEQDIRDYNNSLTVYESSDIDSPFNGGYDD